MFLLFISYILFMWFLCNCHVVDFLLIFLKLILFAVLSPCGFYVVTMPLLYGWEMGGGGGGGC